MISADQACGTSKQANVRESGPIPISQFLVVLNHCTMGRNQLDLRQNVLTVNNIISKFVLALQMMLNINQYCINDKSLIFYACPSVCCGFLRKNNKKMDFLISKNILSLKMMLNINQYHTNDKSLICSARLSVCWVLF